jgi:hypothetical protein
VSSLRCLGRGSCVAAYGTGATAGDAARRLASQHTETPLALSSNIDGADHDVDFRAGADPTSRRARASGDRCEAGQGKRKDRGVSEAGDRRKKSSRAIVPNSPSSAWMAPRAPVSHRRSRPNIRSWRRGGRSKKNESTIVRSRPLNKRSCREIVRNSSSAAWKNRQGIWIEDSRRTCAAQV